MARDKLITIRIEGEKREAFNQLAKSQNTDTASLLYDFISGCLSGTLDVGIVTGKKQRIDKIDNQIDSDRIDKLETTTQEIGERLDKLSQKVEDWTWVSGRSLENNLSELKDQISILAIRLDSQKDSQEMTTQRLDSIDTDSQQDSQRIADMEQLLRLQREASIASPIPPTGEPSPLPPSPDVIDGAGEAIETDDREWLSLQQIAEKKIKGLPGTQQGLRLHAKNWESRKNPQKRGEQYKIPKEYLK